MMTLRQAADALHADARGEDAYFSGVSTDSRTLQRGGLFVALQGDRYDGHRFLAAALEQGAVAAMVSREPAASGAEADMPLLLVEDTRLGLGRLAAYWRERFAIPLIAVTGSNGKTTVKEMLAAILRQAAEQPGTERVLATEGNLNNDVGVPQMLLRLRAQHSHAVIEMGMNHRGEIAYLTRLARPGVALITNAGAAHVEGLGSVEAVARAKGEIFEGLGQSGIAVINADDPHAPLWRRLAGNRQVVDFGLGGHAAVSARYRPGGLGSEVTLFLPDGVEQLVLRVPGEHNVRNALAAAAAAVAVGIGKEVIAAGLGKFGGVPGRMQKKTGLHGTTLIDDSYNANPESVRAALAVLAALPGKRLLVLGDMGELGGGAAEFHRHIGEQARRAGLDGLFALGELSAHAAAEYGAGARHFEQIEALLAALGSELAADVTLLVKGSRFMRMERVVRHFEVSAA